MTRPFDRRMRERLAKGGTRREISKGVGQRGNDKRVLYTAERGSVECREKLRVANDGA